MKQQNSGTSASDYYRITGAGLFISNNQQPSEEHVSKGTNGRAEFCWEARASKDQELTPRISSMEIAGGLDVSGFQEVVGVGEIEGGKWKTWI